MDREALYRQLETASRRAYMRGIQTGSGGNLSARFEGGMIVKASGGSLADCSRDGRGFVETDLEGEVIAGTAVPTREVYLHGLLYKLSDSIGGVMHCHSPWAITWAYGRRSLPAVTLHMQLKAGCKIPVADVDGAVVRPEDEPVIRRLFEENPGLPAFILPGHGVVAVGKDILAAEHMAELVEETAQIAVMKGICEKIGLY